MRNAETDLSALERRGNSDSKVLVGWLARRVVGVLWVVRAFVQDITKDLAGVDRRATRCTLGASAREQADGNRDFGRASQGVLSRERVRRKGRADGTECTYWAVNLDGDVVPWLNLSEVRGRADLDALRERGGNQGSERDEVLHDVGIVWRLS